MDRFTAVGGGGQPSGFCMCRPTEVYGSLGPEGAFTEASPYAPNSPYAASKASADHLVRAWAPHLWPADDDHQLFEQLWSLAVPGEAHSAGDRQGAERRRRFRSTARATMFATGSTCKTHVARRPFASSRPVAQAAAINVGGGAELSNLELVRRLCALLDGLVAAPRMGSPMPNRVTFVADRPGHDWRYAIDATRMRDELGWQPARVDRFRPGADGALVPRPCRLVAPRPGGAVRRPAPRDTDRMSGVPPLVVLGCAAGSIGPRPAGGGGGIRRESRRLMTAAASTSATATDWPPSWPTGRTAWWSMPPPGPTSTGRRMPRRKRAPSNATRRRSGPWGI